MMQTMLQKGLQAQFGLVFSYDFLVCSESRLFFNGNWNFIDGYLELVIWNLVFGI